MRLSGDAKHLSSNLVPKNIFYQILSNGYSNSYSAFRHNSSITGCNEQNNRQDESKNQSKN